MVGEELLDEEAQSLKDLVEEASKPPPQKTNKKKTGKDEATLSKAKSHERTPSLVKQRKGEGEVSMGSPTKIPMAPKKHKGKEKVLEPIVESSEHIDFHFSLVEWGCALLDSPFEWAEERKRGQVGPKTFSCG